MGSTTCSAMQLGEASAPGPLEGAPRCTVRMRCWKRCIFIEVDKGLNLGEKALRKARKKAAKAQRRKIQRAKQMRLSIRRYARLVESSAIFSYAVESTRHGSGTWCAESAGISTLEVFQTVC